MSNTKISTNIKDLKNKNVLYRIVFVIVLVFVLLNIAWMLNYLTYSKYTEGYEKIPKTFIKKVGAYTLTVKKPNYLSFTGNYAISTEDLSYIIWPKLLKDGEYEHGLTIYDTSIDHGYMFYVDSELSYIDVPGNRFTELEVKSINNLLNKNTEELNAIRQIAIEEWDLNIEKSE